MVVESSKLTSLIGSRRWGLSFSGKLEQRFLSDFRKSAIHQTRIVSILGAVLFLLFGLMDRWLVYTHWRDVLLIRYAIILPILFIIFGLSFSKKIENSIEWLSMLGVGVVGLGLLAISVLAVSPFNYAYYLGMMLVIVFGATLLRMRFIIVVMLNLWMFLVFIICILLLSKPLYLPSLGKMNSIIAPLLIFYWLSMMLVACFNSYLFERFSRNQFIQSLLLQYEADELKKMGNRLHQLSITDGLTDLANRRHFESFAKKYYVRAIEQKQYLAIVMVDVDFFKYFNDFYGHQKGDEALQKIAKVLQRHSKRDGELAARYGGEEFVLMYFGQSLEQVAVIAESLRLSVELLNIRHESRDDMDRVTVSVGVSVKSPDSEASWESILNEADERLYKAKKQGRNRVVCY